jgi:poly(hydroxyalkanoate) depolymerase family esterase
MYPAARSFQRIVAIKPIIFIDGLSRGPKRALSIEVVCHAALHHLSLPMSEDAYRMNLNDLSRMRREWAARMPQMGFDPDSYGSGGDGRLQAVRAFGADPGALRMLTYVPDALPPGAPLVVVLHGCTQTASGYDAGTGWSTLADRHGFALLLPEQQRANNAHGCFNWFEPGDTARGEGEVASIRSMIAHMLIEHRLNPRRVYITGLSAGGAMTAALLATYPDVFAGGAIIAGLPYGAAADAKGALAAMFHCRSLPAHDWGDLVRNAGPAPRRLPTVAIWHGDADTTVTPSNALESAKQWTDVHGLREADGVEDRVDGIPHRVWRDRGGAVKVELFAIPGLGHGAPIDTKADGDRGVGHAMPYILNASVSSTWRIARNWGLVGDAPRSAAVAPTRALTTAREILTHTLRAAGLYGSE